MPRNEPTENDIFFDILSDNSIQDEGIALIERQMREVAEDLGDRYVGEGKPMLTHADMEEVEAEINSRWPYHDDTATVSGKVYLAESDIGSVLENFGDENGEDEQGTYYFLEGVSLRSHGIEVVPIFGSPDDHLKLSDVRVGYAFSLLDDDDELPLVTAFPGELAAA